MPIDIEALKQAGMPYDDNGWIIFLFDLIKLMLYTMYFGK
jgi:hypothetical protein